MKSKDESGRNFSDMELAYTHICNRSKIKIAIISVIVGLLVPIAFPVGHMMIFNMLWSDMVNPVNPDTCKCSCWDTVFKGPYEMGVAGYKHVYFNYTSNSLKMWIITVFMVIFLYETFKYLASLASKRTLRISMTILFLSSLHSHYYGWWMQWGYWNDDFYSQWKHQLFFTFSELFSTTLVLNSLDSRKPLQHIPLILIGNVALFHIGIAFWDQFFLNIFKFQGGLHQVLRDLFLMSSDCIQLGVVLFELRQLAKRDGISLKDVISQVPHLRIVLLTTSSMFAYMLLFT